MKSKYFLLSLEDEENEKLTTLLSNKTAKKILKYLSDHEEATASELSKNLNSSASTIHYNLEQLQEAELIEWEHYHYSEKGREVRHYKLASQYIIIAPKKKENALDTLKKLLPSFVVGVLGTVFIGTFSLISNNNQTQMQGTMEADSVGIESARQVSSHPDLFVSLFSSPAFWFLIGSSITLLTMFITLMIIAYRKKNQDYLSQES